MDTEIRRQKRNMYIRFGVLIVASILATSLVPGRGLLAQDPLGREVPGVFNIYKATQKSLRNAAVGTGLQDPEVEDLHAAINRYIERLQGADVFHKNIENTGDMFHDLRVNRFVQQTDESGDQYVRVYLGRGSDATDPLSEHRYVYIIHAFLYPAKDGGLGRVVFQFSRMIYVPDRGMMREVRRLTHDRPPFRSGGEGSVPVNDIAVTYYESEERKSPFRKQPDGVPAPESGGQPVMQFSILQKEDPLPFQHRIMVINAYKKLLRRTFLALRMQKALQELQRPLMLQKVLELPLP